MTLALKPRSVLQACERTGLSVTVTPSHDLKITPKHALTPELREAIKAYKPVLVDYLHQHAENTTSMDGATRALSCTVII